MSTSKKQTVSKSNVGAIIEQGTVENVYLNSPQNNTTYHVTNINLPDNSTSSTFELPPLIETFKGRNEKLNELKLKFNQNTQKNVVITGHGGIGKTELAKQLGHDMLAEDLVEQVMWFNAEHMTYNREEVMKTFNKFKQHKCLCIYDNCVEISKIKEYMPPTHYNFFILLTSQEKVPDYEEVMLNILSLKAALEVIKAVLTTDYREEVEPQYKKLAELVSCVPLGLQVVAGYIKMSITGGMDPSNIINCVQTLEEDVTNITIFPKLCNPYNKTIYSVIKVSVDRLFDAKHVPRQTKNLTIYILCILTYLNPEEIFRKSLLNIIDQIPNIICTESDIESSLHFISNYNLITYINRQVKLHRLMQLSLKHYFEEERSQKINKMCYTACILWLCNDRTGRYYHREYVMRYAEQNIDFIFNFYKTYSKTNFIFLQLLVKCSCTECITTIAKYHSSNFQHIMNKYELLYIAVHYSTIGMAECLLNIGADTEQKGRNIWGSKHTPLFLAAAQGDLNMIRMLVAHGADTTARDANGRIPLHIYCRRARPSSSSEMLEALNLLNINVNWRVTTNSGETLMHEICGWRCNVHLLRHILDNFAWNIDSQDEHGNTAMHVLCYNIRREDKETLECLKVLMQYKPKLQIQNNYCKKTCVQVLNNRSESYDFNPNYYLCHMTS